MNCLIVDDEPIAREILLKYCNDLPYLQAVAVCDNAIQAKEELQKHSIDLFFLDINMPVLDGLSFLRTLKSPPAIILTTAYKEYAIDAFDLAAVDYLVKPFSFERFIIAVDKVRERKNIESLPMQSSKEEFHDSIFIKSNGKIFQVKYDDIILAEAKGNYTQVLTNSVNILTPMSFSEFESLLPKNIFIRVHRSFIINRSKIDHIEGNIVHTNKKEIPIGSNYREAFFRWLNLYL
jgi:two-component system LytT family response regulator